MTSVIFVLLALSSIAGFGSSDAATFGLRMHHRFSDPVRRWTESRSPPNSGHRQWPDEGTAEYYAVLAHHDRALRGRSLTESQALTFSDGNATIEISSLGFLHYALVTVGTPNVTFLVALDTGSDLFWLPCDCISCAPTSYSSNGNEIELSIYNPNTSTTSQTVPCSNSLCELQSQCTGSNTECPYNVAYVSANTSSSGVLVEDVLYLTTEDTRPEITEARIVFGCGQVQTGSFLDAAAPNGLFGLGMEKISVPSILSSAGLTSDSFSMCFGADGIGRISFGDKGSSDQDETPFNIKQSQPTYNLSVIGISVGNTSSDLEFSALIDSGTSFTYLAEPAYTLISENFNRQVKEKRYSSDTQIPFEYCYLVSSNDTVIINPDVSLKMKGGSQFPVSNPIIVVSIQQHKYVKYVYCLAVIKSSNLNIIGQNFMSGLRIVFDRERKILGWKKFNCYEIEDTNSLPVNSHNSSAPAPAVGSDSYNPEATKDTGKGTEVTTLTPPTSSHSSRSNSFTSIACLMALLPLVIF